MKASKNCEKIDISKMFIRNYLPHHNGVKRFWNSHLNSNMTIEIINNKARHNLMDAKCRWCSDRLDGAVSFREPLGQTKVMQIRQGETLNHPGAITHEVCCLAAQYSPITTALKISKKFW